MPNATQELATAVARLLEGQKHDIASPAPATTGYLHGPGGLLSFAGVDNTVFHSMVGARSMLSMIPARATNETNPMFAVITGVRADSGSEPAEPCDDAPIAGDIKACYLTSPYGRYERATVQLELNRLGQVVNRGDPMDLTLVGSPVDGNIPFPGGFMSSDIPGDLLRNEIASRFWSLNVAVYRLLSRQLWSGTPVNNNAGGGYKEVAGLETLIATGHVDAETGVACASLDPYIHDFSARVDTNGPALVTAITNMAYQLQDRADRGGMSPVRWAIAMRPQLFYELSAIWPCAYLTNNCTVINDNGQRVNIDARDASQMRDDMRNGRYLLINGERWPVVLDDGITELSGNDGAPAGCFETDIFFIPMAAAGRSLTYLEYYQFDNSQLNAALARMPLAQVDGAFLTWIKQTNECVQWQVKIEPRLVLRTPWLAGRITDVQYCPIQHTLSAFPDDPYHVNGGKSLRDGPSYYSMWQS